MKRLILSAMFALFATSLALTSQGATAQVPPSSTVPAADDEEESEWIPIFACYDLDDISDDEDEDADAEDEEDSDDEALISLATGTFGADSVELGDLEILCISSNRAAEDDTVVDAPAAEDTRVLACFGVDDGNDPREGFSFSTDSFGADAVAIRDAELVCEEASLTTEDDETVGEATGAAWYCYSIRRGDDPDLDISYANIFTSDDAKIDSAVTLCELATEYGDDADVEPTDDEPVTEETDEAEVEEAEETLALLACYDLDKADDPEVTVTIETSTLGSLDVVVGQAVLLCEAATTTDDDAPARNGVTTSGDESESDSDDNANDDDDDAPEAPIVQTITRSLANMGTDTNGNGPASNTDDDEPDTDLDAEIARIIQQLRDDPDDDAVVERLMTILDDHDVDNTNE